MYNKLKLRGIGFFISPNLFVTNFHVLSLLLKNAKNLNSITLLQEGNPNILNVEKIVSVSALYDLAIIKIKESSQHYLKLSKTEAKVNEELFSVGYFNKLFTRMKKTGRISYKNDTFFSFPASHSELDGNSGSPFLNNKGEVVGVLFQGNTNTTLTLKINHLKKFIAGNIGQNCESINFKNCLEKEIKNLETLAEQGSALAQLQLTYRYESNRKTIQNKEKILELLKKSAEQDYILAQDKLGWMYQYGEGVKKDIGKAVQWYHKAAEQGFAPTQNNLAWMYEYGEGVKKI